MNWFRRLRYWWSDPRRRQLTAARRELDRLFQERRALLVGTSLRPEHRGRVQVVDVVDDPVEILFAIIRHPRPYPFSRQVHEVMEVWNYRVTAGQVERVRGHNLSRKHGGDGDPAGDGAGL